MAEGTGKLLAGVDAGGTQTRVLLLDSVAGRVGTGLSGPGNVTSHPPGEVAERVAEALGRARQSLGSEAGRPLRLAGGFAGAGTSTRREELATALRETLGGGAFPGAEVTIGEIVTDIEIAQMGAFAGQPGVVIVAGTGSSAFGRDRLGHTSRAGGWGWPWDDAGSARAIGLGGVQAIARAADGRGNATVLKRLAAFDPEAGFPPLLRESEASLAWLHRVARAVFEAAMERDPVALGILEQQAEALAELAATVMLKLAREAAAKAPGEASRPLPVALTGGLSEIDLYTGMVGEALTRSHAEVVLQRPVHSALGGAVLLAGNPEERADLSGMLLALMG